MQCRGCAFVWCPVIADVLVQCVRVVQLNCVKVQCMACCVSGSDKTVMTRLMLLSITNPLKNVYIYIYIFV